MLKRNINHITALLCASLSFVVYILTLAPTVWFIDSGELSAVASTLGIAHPTGYPLFTIVGHIFTLLPFSASEVYKLNLMSAFFSSLAVFMFYHLVYFIIQRIDSELTEKRKHKSTNSYVLKITAASSSLILAWSLTFWNSANSVEVYPMHSFFIITLSYVFLRAIFYDEDNHFSEPKNKFYIIFAFLLGLSFTNHLTTILLAPACLTLFFVANSNNRRRLYRLLGLMTICFIAGLSVYIYLPLRMQASPDFMWGSPHNLERFIWHVTGKQFSVWIFSAKGSITAFLILMASVCGLSVYGLLRKNKSGEYIHFLFFIVICVVGYFVISSSDPIVKTQLVKFTSSLWGQFGAAVILISVPGIYHLSRNNRKIYYFTVLTFFGCVFYSINYDIHDIYSYFLLAYITIAVWISCGLLYISRWISEALKSQGFGYLLLIILISLPVIPLLTNYSENDESKNYYVEEMTMNIFKNIEPGGIVLSSQWDFWLSASWYYNFVKNIRKDIVVIDKELLRRSWYFMYLEKHYPEIYNNSRKEIEAFLAELYKFEHGIPYSTPYIIQLFEDLLTSFVKNNPERKFYVSWEIEQNKNEPFARDYTRIPDGLLFRLVHKDSLVNGFVDDYKIYDFGFTPVTKKDYYHETLMKNYSMMLTASANYLASNGRTDDARFYINLALKALPEYAPAHDIKKKYGL
ncbi:MAG: DUF2723 domain-containing protein [Ignavibacteria bacterium]|nr:DUF2723 domain-containing protein [Ignavibacteria bacterium]